VSPGRLGRVVAELSESRSERPYTGMVMLVNDHRAGRGGGLWGTSCHGEEVAAPRSPRNARQGHPSLIQKAAEP
jgi:hypothetical protein